MNITELLDQLPETDKVILSRLPPPVTEEEKKARRREGDPDPGGTGSKFTGPDFGLANRLVEQVLEGGRRALAELIKRIHPVDDSEFADYRAEYLLHCVVLYTGTEAGRRSRKMVARVLAEHVASPTLSHGIKSVLIRELQWAGGAESVDALAGLLADESLCQESAAALLLIGPSGTAALRKAFEKSQGHCRVVLAQALGRAGDTRSRAALRGALADKDTDLQLCAASALARMGDAQATGPLLKLAMGNSGYAGARLHGACLVLAETLERSGKADAAREIHDALRDRKPSTQVAPR